MNKEKYDKLLLRFALELSEVGVTDDLIKLVQAAINRAPNISSSNCEEIVSRFTYRHNGYMIEAKQTVELVVKKCK